MYRAIVNPIYRAGIVLAVFGLAHVSFQAGDLNPPGPPAPTMKTLTEVEPRTPISSLPITISTSGSYYLTQSLTGVIASDGIAVDADNVTIDLNGFSLVGVPGTNSGILSVTGKKNLIIKNGTVSGWAVSGIYVNGDNTLVTNVLVEGNEGMGISLTEGRVVDCFVRGNGSRGIRVANGFGSLVRGCTVSDNAGTGIEVGGGAGHRIEGNTSSFNGAAGISVAGDSSVVNDNVCSHNGAAGIHVFSNGNLIDGNFVTLNETGIQVVIFPFNTIVRNTADSNTALNYNVPFGNYVGTIVTTPVGAGPWDNFEY